MIVPMHAEVTAKPTAPRLDFGGHVQPATGKACTRLHFQLFGNFLLIFWPCSDDLISELVVRVNGNPLPGPMLGIELTERQGYLIGAPFVVNLQASGLWVQLSDSEGHELACSDERLGTPLADMPWWGWLSDSRPRIERALIQQARTLYPRLPQAAWLPLLNALACPEVRASQGPEGLFLVRLPWTQPRRDGMVQGRITPVAENGASGATVPVSVLLEQDALHLVFRPDGNPEGRLWILQLDKGRCVSFRFPRVQAMDPQPLSLGQWLSGLGVDGAAPSSLFSVYARTAYANLQSDAACREPAPPAGCLQGLRGAMLTGWAVHPEQPGGAVTLRVGVDNGEAFRIEAAQMPARLAAGMPDGARGFAWPLPDAWMDGSERRLTVRVEATGELLPGCPMSLGRGHFDGEIQLDHRGWLVGWLRERCAAPRAPFAELWLDDRLIALIKPMAWLDGQRQIMLDSVTGNFNLRLELPEAVFDTNEHVLGLRIPGAMKGNAPLFERLIRLRAEYRCQIDTVTAERLTGRVVNSLAPRRPVPLEVWVNDHAVASGRTEIHEESRAGSDSLPPGTFDIVLPDNAKSGMSQRIELVLGNSGGTVLAAPVVVLNRDALLRALGDWAGWMKSMELGQMPAAITPADPGAATWLRSRLLVPMLAELRRSGSLSAAVTLTSDEPVLLPMAALREASVDVIVPVHGARDLVVRCLHALLAARCEQPLAIVVIDDASGDPELTRQLRQLARSDSLTLIENPARLGFVASSNIGMRLHPGRDVVLLNSDTVVAGDWLDRLRAAAHSDGRTATATPFSNNATILSFPEANRSNEMPAGISVAQLDRLFARHNRAQVVPIPTAVGFCMYIRRDALDEVGYFDEGRWGFGYAEENDFCIRATALGWRHVAACDVFVEHAGGASFGHAGGGLLKHNLDKLHRLYPDYPGVIARFLQRDPLLTRRRRILVQMLRDQAESHVLMVTHALGGGVARAVRDLTRRLVQEGIPVLELLPVSAGLWQLGSAALPCALIYAIDEFDALIDDLRILGVWHVHFHHTLHFAGNVHEIPARLRVGFDISLHDYLPVCPRINLIDETGQYCGETQFHPDICTRCIEVNGTASGLENEYRRIGGTVASWRRFHHDLFTRARRIFAPSRDARDRLARHFELENLVFQAPIEPRHSISLPRSGARGGAIAVLGAIGPHKGYDLLRSCAQNARKLGLPLRFVIIGHTADDASLMRLGNVTITGAYGADDLSRLIHLSGARLALFLSPWPETYSYTLSEAWVNGLYPLALDLGAPAERIRDSGCGRLIDPSSDPDAINRILLEELGRLDQRPVIEFEFGGMPDTVLDSIYEFEPKRQSVSGGSPT